MLTKLLLGALLVAAAWLLIVRPLLRPRGLPPGRRARAPEERALALTRCPRCGAYRLDDDCGCDRSA